MMVQSSLIAGCGVEPMTKQRYGSNDFYWRLGDYLLALFGEAELEQMLANSEQGSERAKEFLNIQIHNLSADSRELDRGSLFISLAGESFDYRENILSAIDAGASAIFQEQLENGGAQLGLSQQGEIPVIQISQLKQRLGEFAACFFNETVQPRVVAVTGTNGKTSCAWMMANAASRLQERSAVVGTLGWGVLSGEQAAQGLTHTGYTTPNALEVQRIMAELAVQDCDVVAMEVSSHALSQWRVAAVDIQTAIFTNLSHDHLDYHGTMDAYANAKLSLFEMPSVKQAVINLDDSYAQHFINRLNPEANYLTYGIESEKADVRVLEASFTAEGIEARVLTPLGELELTLDLIGRFNLSNALAVVAGLLVNERSLVEIQQALAGLAPPPGRAQRIHTKASEDDEAGEDIVAVVDFAHTPDALENILRSLKEHCAGQLWCVFGCGGDRDQEKRGVMAGVAENSADQIVVTRDNSRSEKPEKIIADICSGFTGRSTVTIESVREDAIEYAITRAQSGDVVLIAGKGHEEYIEEGGVKTPFSDAEHVRKALQLRMESAA